MNSCSENKGDEVNELLMFHTFLESLFLEEQQDFQFHVKLTSYSAINEINSLFL